MRFLLGVLVGYSMPGKKKLLITVLATVVFIVYIVLPAAALLALHLDVQRERQSRPAQTTVPSQMLSPKRTYEVTNQAIHLQNQPIDSPYRGVCAPTILRYLTYESVSFSLI